MPSVAFLRFTTSPALRHVGRYKVTGYMEPKFLSSSTHWLIYKQEHMHGSCRGGIRCGDREHASNSPAYVVDASHLQCNRLTSADYKNNFDTKSNSFSKSCHWQFEQDSRKWIAHMRVYRANRIQKPMFLLQVYFEIRDSNGYLAWYWLLMGEN